MNKILPVLATIFLLFTIIGAAQTQSSGGNQPPVADPGGPYYGTVGVLVKFDGSASYDPDGTITDHYWQYTDGFFGWDSHGVTAEHTFGMAGTFPLSLMVTDNDGATSTIAHTEIIITPQQVIAEVPLGTIMASAAMIFALVGYFAVPRIRKKE